MGTRRRPVNKRKSAKQFKERSNKTASLNLSAPRRGGWRL